MGLFVGSPWSEYPPELERLEEGLGGGVFVKRRPMEDDGLELPEETEGIHKRASAACS